MDPTSATSITPTTTTSTAGLSSSTDPAQLQSQFMKLFVAQLQNQDPLDPSSGSDMVAQLAQLSSLEQQVQTNTDLTSLISGQNAQSSAQIASLVGKNATINASSVQLQGTAPQAATVNVDAPITGGTVTVKDASGTTMETVTLPAGSGPFPITLAGPNGAPLPAGTYSISVAANGVGSTTVNATPEITGTIAAVDLGASTQLQIGNALVNPSAVLSIGATGGNQ